MFEQVADRAELTFVEYASTPGPGATPRLYEPYGRLTTWEEHRSARSLLRAVQPDLIAMLAIGGRNQIALRCQAKRQGVRTIHLEHGYRLPLATQRALREEQQTSGNGAPRWTKSTLATHRFFAGSLPWLPPAEAARLVRYALPSIGGASFEALGTVAELRRPDRYVSFAPECFAFHRELDLVPSGLAEETLFVGVPQFDCFRSDRGGAEPDSGTVVVIDHQLHNTGLLGWNPEFHREWIEGIHAAVVATGRRLVVKIHPGDRTSRWAEYADGSVEIVPSIEQLEQRARSARIVLGIMSTLQLPLAGLDHTTMITVEIHPRPREVLSSRLVGAGVAHPVASFDELRTALDDASALHERQLSAKPAFVEQFLHRLDGRAEERLTEALLAEARTGAATGVNAR